MSREVQFKSDRLAGLIDANNIFGAQLTKLSSAFDSRNYGYKKLSDLVRATDMFEVRETPHGKSATVKDLHIRLKP